MFDSGMKFSITSFYKYAVPFGTPAPSAFVMGINLHKFMVDALGGEYAWVAWIVAVAGVIGMEGVGGLSSILVSRAYIKHRPDIMRLAILAVIGYAAFVGIGIYTGDDSRALLATVALTLLGYFVLALWDGMQTIKEEREENLDTLHAETELARQQASIARANARAARDGQANVVRSVQRTSVQGLDAEKLRQTRGILAGNPNATTREIAAALGFASPSSGKVYKDAAQKV